MERRSEPELDGRSVLSVDPTALLQLPPKRLSARLEALGRRLEDSLEPVGVPRRPVCRHAQQLVFLKLDVRCPLL